MILPKWLGKITYIITWPGIRIALLGTDRVYAVIKVNNEILVTKNWLGLHKKWRLPGGGIKRVEDPIIGLKRELKEELGIEIDDFDIIKKTTNPINNKAGYKYQIFMLNLAKKPHLSINKQEVAEHGWIDYKKLTDYPCSDELKYILQNLL